MAVFSIISAGFSGNRGAEAMLRSAIENITQLLPDSRFHVLSVYPHEDVNENDYPNVEVIDCRPKIFMTRVFLEAFIYRFLRKIPAHLLSSASLSILASDLILDLSGVSFVDGRGIPILIYNAQCVLIPRWLGKPVIKLSQATGPFKNIFNKLLAQYCLNQVSVIGARGYITAGHLKGLGLKNFVEVTDLAFSLQNREVLPVYAEEQLNKMKQTGKQVVGICPSVVVEEYCTRAKIDYYIILNRFIDFILSKGYQVVLFAHSAREFSNTKKNNDLPLCRELMNRRKNSDDVLFFDEILNTFELRTLISKMDLFVGSRFHAIISALCVAVPFFLIGWSHKYGEVLDRFELSGQAMDFKDLSVQNLCAKFEDMVQNKAAIISAIERNMPANYGLSVQNAHLAAEYIRSKA